MILNFNIHNIFKFKVISTNKRFLNYIDREYSFFKVDKIKNPDLMLRIGEFKPNNKNCHIIDHKYFVKKNYFYCKDSYKVVKWKVQISGVEDKKTIVDFNGNFFADSFLCRYIIEPIMRFKTNKKGYAWLHSSGVSDGKNAFLITTCKGVGKTSTVLHLVNRGGIYLSDDFTILSNKGKVYSYPTTVHFFDYNLKGCPFIRKKLPPKEKFMVKFYDFLFRITLGYGSLPVDIRVEDIFEGGKTGKSYPLKSLILLTKKNTNKFTIKKSNKEIISRQIIPINIIEAFNFYDYMLAYSFIFPKSEIATHWKRLEKNLLNALKDIKCYQVDIPEKYTSDTFKSIESLLKKNGYFI